MSKLPKWPLLISLAAALPVAFGQYLISTVAGGGPPDGSVATAISVPSSNVAADSAGNVYTPFNNRVYKIATNGIITAVVGIGTPGFSGDNGPALGAQLNSPTGVAVDSSGNLYIADNGNFRIRKVSGGTITTVAGNGTSGFSGDNGPATSAHISVTNGVAVDGSGILYIADSGNYRIRKVSGGTITTAAGNGSFGFSGDNGLATSAQISYPFGVAVDNSSNLIIADSYNSRIRMVSGGIITTVAGNGTAGYSGDNGLATSAQVSFPYRVVVDSSGNLFIADTNNFRIRKVSGGVITTIAGTGQSGYSGDNGPAVSAEINHALGVAADNAGDLFIADTNNFRIRKVSGGTITTIAGDGVSGYSGDGGPATSAQFGTNAVAVDNLGSFYIDDANNHRIRKVSGGTITTVAGNGTSGYSGDNGPATSAQIGYAYGIAADTAGNLYISDSPRIRKVSGGTITTVAGNGTTGFSGDGGPATSAALSFTYGVAVDATGTLYIADAGNNRVRKVTAGVITTVAGGGFPNGSAATAISIPSTNAAVDSTGNVYVGLADRVVKIATNGIVTTLAGNGSAGYSGDNGPATSAQVNNVNGVAIDGSGNFYIADSSNYRIRKVSGGTITTVAGNGTFGSSGDNGSATSAQISFASGIAVDGSGNLFIADSSNYRIRKVSGGTITTVAGNGTPGFSGDNGAATSAQLNFATGVAVDGSGNLYIADSSNYRIRKVSGGTITTVAGTGTSGYSGDNGPAITAQISGANGVAIDSSGNLLIADTSNYSIRKVSAGTITTVAGNGSYGYSGDNGPATSAALSFAQGIAADNAGNFYIADSGNYRVRKVSGGVITTIAGNGSPSFSGDGGQATNAQLGSPSGLAVDTSGNLYISDTSNNRVRMVTTGGTITTFAGGGTGGLGDGGPATSGSLSSPVGIAVDAASNVYVDDFGNKLLRKISGGTISTITTISAIGSFPLGGDGGVAVTSGGNIYLGDPVSGRILLLVPGVGVSNVTSSAANGSYSVAAVIPIQVTFNANVTVTGTPQLSLNSGGIASYASGSGTSTLTFNYTVGGGQTSPHLDYSSTSALTLNGGTILGPTSSPALLTLSSPGFPGSLAANKNIAIVLQVAVPNVVNSTKASAITAITNAGLVTGTITTVTSISVPVGSVVSENPSAGTLVTLGSSVDLVISGSQPISVGPASGNAGRQVFTFVARDSGGANNIQYAQFLFSKAGISALNACYISYDPNANVFYLLSDDLTQWYGLLGGSSNTIGNAQCEIHGATSGSSKSGTDLTVTVDLSFRSLFAGVKTIYEFSGDTVGNGSGWDSVGTWNDTGDLNIVEVTSLSPLPGSGFNQTLTMTVQNGLGATQIAFSQLVMNTTLNGINACFIHYDRASNVFFLLNDAGTGWFGLVAGSATQVSNSQCTLHGVGSGGGSSGSTLTINYNLTFAAGFAGTKQVYAQAVDAGGNIEVWHNEGSDNP